MFEGVPDAKVLLVLKGNFKPGFRIELHINDLPMSNIDEVLRKSLTLEMAWTTISKR
jgi:hypothetical protein